MAQFSSRAIGYVLSFVSAPIIVSGLGLRGFGIWALTGSLAQYAGLLDLGAGVSLGRYIAAFQEDRRLCGEYMAVGWLSVAAIAVVLGPLAVFAAAFLSHTLHGVSVADMRVVLVSSVILLCCTLVTSVLTAYPIGRRRMMAPNVGLAIGSVINFAASVGSIALGAHLPAYAMANAGAGICSVLITAILVFRSEGYPPISRPQGSRARAFLSYSTKNQLVRVMDLVNYQTDKIVIAFAIGPAAAGAYELANRVAIAVRTVGVWATSATDIELASLMARFGIDRVRARYARFTEIAALFGFPPVLLVMATAPILLQAWLSHSPQAAEQVLVALSGAYLIAVSTGASYGVAKAAGEPGIVARTSAATAVANIALTASLAPFFGIWGVLSGTVVALTAGAIAQVVYVHRRYSLPASSYLNAVTPALRVYAALAIPVAALSYSHLFHGRGAAAVALVLLSAAYLAACAAWSIRAGKLPAALSSRLPALPWLRRPADAADQDPGPAPPLPTARASAPE